MNGNPADSRFGAVSRRSLLRGATALGTAALLPLGSGRAAAQPKQGGTLRLAMAHGSSTDSYDPAMLENAFAQVFATARNGYMTEIAADGSLTGDIAESWEASPDARVWTFKLREGVTFHSGKPVTAEDVIASLDYHRGEESTSAAKPIVAPIVEIAADGPGTVVVTLESGNADFPFVISDYHLPILPATDGRIDPLSPDGCGGYVVESYEPGVRASMTRNPNYWKLPDRAHFDAVELLTIIDAAARQNALITGEVDVIDQVDVNTVHLLQRAPGVQILSTTGTQHFTFAMDTRAAPFSDNNVRLALKYAIDRQELLDKVLNGYGALGNDQPVGPSDRFFADLPQRVYDPDKAKFHLKEAGLDTLQVPLSAADAAFPGAVDAAVLYSEQAAAAGITIDVIREPNDGYWSNVWMVKPFVAVYWSGRPTADWMFSTAYAAGVAWNDTFWDNERFNQLLNEARSELDETKRAEMYREMQLLVRDDGGVVIPMFASYVMGLSDAIGHPEQVGANWTLDGFRAVERWWFA